MTERIGVEQAKLVGDTHEAYTPPQFYDPQEEMMDFANNAAGRDCGLLNDSKSCEQRCLDKYNQGKLFGMGAAPMAPSEQRDARDPYDGYY